MAAKAQNRDTGAEETGGVTAWIYDNGWQQAEVWIYDNGWQRAEIWIYDNGWN